MHWARDTKERRDVQVVICDSDSSKSPCNRSSLPRHPGLANVIDTEKPGEPPYLVVEIPPGKSLNRIVSEQGRYAAADFMTIGSQLLLAVHHLHELGLVHRNIHGDSVFLWGNDARTARVKLTGVATCVRDQGSPDVTRVVSRPDIPRLEQHQHLTREDPDARNDVFSLGLLLMDAVELGPQGYPDITARRLQALCNRCMSPNKDDRPANAGQMLEAFLACFPRPSRVTAVRPDQSTLPVVKPGFRFRWLGGRGMGAVAATVISGAFLVLLPPRGCEEVVAGAAVLQSAVTPVAVTDPTRARTIPAPSGASTPARPSATAVPPSIVEVVPPEASAEPDPELMAMFVDPIPTCLETTPAPGTVSNLVMLDPKDATETPVPDLQPKPQPQPEPELDVEAAAEPTPAPRRRRAHKKRRNRRKRARRLQDPPRPAKASSSLFMGVSP
ncbi:MAG: protein kinase [Myxococcota bacterium]